VGGGFSLKWLGGDNYELTLKVLRDCQNGSPNAYFDIPLTAGIFDIQTNQRLQTINIPFVEDDTISFVSDGCAEINTGCTHVGVYKKNITLLSSIYNNSAGYYFSWERCCRNGIIANIVKPGDAGMACYMEIPPPKFIKNSTPYFTKNPNTLLCTNNVFRYNLNFIDDDGDDLVYSLVEPLNGTLDRNNPASNNPTSGPYPSIIWATSFDNNNIIRGAIPLRIDSKTGELIVNPSYQGVYVASIRVEEFRFGKKLGEVRLELQFTVSNCPNDPPITRQAELNDVLIPFDTIEVAIPEEICFKIEAFDNTDSIKLRVNSPALGLKYQNLPRVDTFVHGLKYVRSNFCWQTNCEHQGIAPQPFYVDALDNGCPINRRVEGRFVIKIKSRDIINPIGMLCMSLYDDNKTIVYYGDSTPDTHFLKYYIYRGINNSNYVLYDSIFDKNMRYYEDINTPSNKTINYSYFIRGINKCGIIGPSSDTLSTFDQIKFRPDQQFIVAASVEDDKYVSIKWPKTYEKDFAKYFLYRSVKGIDSFNIVDVLENPTDTFYLDKNVNVNSNSYCYYVDMLDTCDNLSPKGWEACTILLKGESKPFVNLINWSSYDGWPSGTLDYSVLRFDPANPFKNIAILNSKGFAFVDDKLNINEGLFRYYINASQELSENHPYYNAHSTSNSVELLQSPVVYTPNAFTANGDGLNDVFGWVPVFVKDFHLSIFNRWGQNIFTTNNKNEFWPATVNGSPAPEDVYFYILHYTGWEGTEKDLKGNFTLLR